MRELCCFGVFFSQKKKKEKKKICDQLNFFKERKEFFCFDLSTLVFFFVALVALSLSLPLLTKKNNSEETCFFAFLFQLSAR